MNYKKILTILGIIGMLGGWFGGGYIWLNKSFASSSEFVAFKTDTTYEFLHLRLEKITDRIWKLKDRLIVNPTDRTSQEELLKLEEEKVRILKKIGLIDAKKGV